MSGAPSSVESKPIPIGWASPPPGTYVANEVAFYVRLSCIWGSSGNTFGTDVSGDNVLGMGTTKTSWNLQ